ncbi:SulP family inorganic anion transporter [Marinobacter salexigens]|uniref:SulP family inorganic anion transporter n=1 Tax=Marinobacter salexigens TaxID=1925763 RepID=A0ABS6AA71_9GAMM|nr:SulP family inorganic anion transporter [Marinobacter salexigens]MBU2874659.1 SulP family inorganic anion transporter [Marinobacter salexigens]
MLFKLFPFLKWARPTKQQARADAIAGITVGLVLIPQALAYAQLAGMPPVTGLYAALLPGIVGALFGSSSILAVGPVALTSLLTFAALQPLAEAGSPEWVVMAIWLALYSGLMQFAMGTFRMGILANLVSNAVLQGFVNAAAVIIIVSQVPSLLGFSTGTEGGWLSTIRHEWQQDSFRLMVTAGFGLSGVVVLRLLRKFSARLPAVMVVTLIGIAGSYLLGFGGHGGSVIGPIGSGLPELSLPLTLSIDQHLALLLPAAIIALISFTEAMSSCRTMSRMTGEPWDRNQELIGQGLAKMASGFSGAFPVSGSFSRTALNAYSGAKTARSTLIASLVVLTSLFGFTQLLYHLPTAILASIIIVPVTRLIDVRSLIRLCRENPKDGAVAIVTLIVTLLTVPNLYWGIVAGMAASLLAFLYHHAMPRIIELGVHETGGFRDRSLYQLPPIAEGILGLRMDASLTYLTAPMLERAIRKRVDADPNVRAVLISASSLNQVDSTGLDTLQDIWSFLDARGITLYLSGPKLPLREALSRTGLAQHIKEENIFATDSKAIETFSL